MGQKVNPNILRLGVNKTWKTKFFEKKNQELPLYIFKDLEIKTYIERFLENHGFVLHDYRQHYSNSTLNLYVSYFITTDFYFKKDENRKITLINKIGEKQDIQDSNLIKHLNSSSPSESLNFAITSTADFYKVKKYLKALNHNSQKFIQVQQTSLVKNQTPQSRMNSGFDSLFKVLNLFSNNKLNIVVNFCCINKDLTFLKFSQTKKFSLLQKFRNTPFLKDGIELLFHVVYNKNSANLLAQFVASQLKKNKRQKLFFSFLKQTLSVLIDSNFSKVKGVKIIVKGRLNGVPRAKHKTINVGEIPVQSINEDLDYSQTTIHNSNGSYGIKAWVVGR